MVVLAEDCYPRRLPRNGLQYGDDEDLFPLASSQV